MPPAGAVIEPPKQLVEASGTLEMVMPAGRLSVKARLLTGEPLALVMSNRSVETLPGPMVFGVKDLSRVG